MTTVTVLAIIDFDEKPNAPLTRLMNQRLEQFAADLQMYLEKALPDVSNSDDLVIYISYSSNYTIRWVIVNDVHEDIYTIVADKCAKLGYITWKNVDMYKFRNPFH
jgi:hypothetical protein